MKPYASIEIARLRMEMARRNLSAGPLADRAGIPRRVLTNVLTGNNKTWPPRRAINEALGEKMFIAPSRHLKSLTPSKHEKT